MTARKPAKKSFCFAYLLVSVVVTLSSLTAMPRKAALEMRRFLLKTDDWMENARRNRRPQATIEAHYCLSQLKR